MFYFPTHIQIISGGQTGVDRAALDFALGNQITCSGWCPSGRIAEDGKIPQKYPLKETGSTEYSERTNKNILDSDGTLVIYSQNFDDGTRLTIELCKKYNKPCLEINLINIPEIPQLTKWIQNHQIRILNIAGPRESNCPGIYLTTLKFLNSLIEKGI